jgi:Predicted nucleotide-binding protein containing TIR-like domain
LLEQNGLIEIETRTLAGAYYVRGLTWRGREFLERDLKQETPTRKDEMPSRTKIPDIEWYLRISAERGVTPRCPFASVERCPRYYQSLSALGPAKISVELTASEDKRLRLHWEKSELWPKSEEDSTYMFGNGEKYHSFSNFCPEVAYERFKYFAGHLVDYHDAEESHAARQRLTQENCPTESWQWEWAGLTPLHFTECPLYSPLIHATSAAKQQPKDSIESAIMPALKEPAHITLAEGLVLLESHLSIEQAKTRLRQAFIRGVLGESPRFAFEYDEADIDWATGSVKLPRKPDRFCPSFLRADFNAYFFKEHGGPAAVSTPASGPKVFVVHGHDEGALDAMARFLEKIEIEPIVLQEQPDQGFTIIEKFETYAKKVGFAVVLLTPDDLGGSASASSQSARARQNVIFELGYFVGKLGRGRACLLRKGEVEIPSDLYGVIYTEMDSGKGWKLKLAKELKAAEILFNQAKVLDA